MICAAQELAAMRANIFDLSLTMGAVHRSYSWELKMLQISECHAGQSFVFLRVNAELAAYMPDKLRI